MKKIVLAYSGGLDTSIILRWLQENYNAEIIAYTSDIGQVLDKKKIVKNAKRLGVKKIIIENLKNIFVKDYVFPMIRAHAVYEGVYLLGTSIARPLIAKRQVEIAKKFKAFAVSHGATGKGNDQVRFELGYAYFGKNKIKTIAPWREWKLQSRADLIKYAKKNKISIVQTIAVPRQSPYEKSVALNLLPEVGSLFKEIIETLDNNGEELLADNILFRSNKLGIKSKNFLQEQRYLMSNKVINKYMWITGGVILVNPLPAVDFLTTTSVNLQMIMELSKIYEIKLSKKDAKDLATSLLSALAKQGILKGGLAILSPALATSLTKIILSKSIQSVTTGWLIRIVGLSLVEYFKNGQDWGDGGIQEVVDQIYRISKREDILNNFVKEAISKIEMNKYFKSNKSLPPFTM